MARRLLALFTILCFILVSLFFVHSSPTYAAVAPTHYSGIHADGPQLVNAAGLPVVLHGVDRSGGEFGCVQTGNQMWNGPMDQSSISAMLTWKINAVRVPLNEDCWLGINGANPGGSTYQQNVVSYVNLAIQNGLYVILDLHWTNAGSTLATNQQPMPDADHASSFWTGVATTFKNNGNVIFDLFNEPYPDNNSESTAAWTCWKNGGTCNGMSYPAVGMQSLVNTVRATGANNLIMLGGVEYSNDLQQWLTYEPTDSANNLAASWHSYNFNLCSNSSCWNQYIAPVKAKVPVIAGEIGENDCASGYINSLMSWMDGEGISYLAWTWNNWDCSTGPALITDYTGTATNFGAGYKAHLASLSGGNPPTNTPVPQPTKTNTPVPTATQGTGPTATKPPATNTPASGPTNTPAPGGNGLTLGLDKGGGIDNNQETSFNVLVKNSGASAISNVSFRVYFTTDGSNAGSGYVMEKYYDQSGVATISSPTLASGSTYYFTISYGTTSLAAGASWEFQTALHLSSWASTYDGSNDWYHTGYAVGALPASYTNTNYIPGYVSGSLVWGSAPGGSSAPTATNTFVPAPSATPAATKTNTPVPTSGPSSTPAPTTAATKTNTPAVTSTPAPTNSGSDPCSSPTVITGSGTYTVSTASICFKYVNTSFVNGGMFSVMKDSSSMTDTLKWYGGMDQNATSCANQSATVSGNGGQLNNFTVAKDANGQMFLIVSGTGSNSLSISIQNWQNGSGCSVKPTVHP